ncbi:hypothetical protein NUU61_006557 [Penicillium alfredii]|uniref:TLDc domain-containing protein n=1 Tax=Penicillium alfredii TaxID=1506179 RepID=A0A9W9F155_9EURO|nr:uncharacterized protein NUU61_006557 [Penicillium alfredii]KAJ5091687.1 hypothetical protein NUU61_006557 [Penicillium alfredii]
MSALLSFLESSGFLPPSLRDARALVKLLVVTWFGKRHIAVEDLTDLDHVVDCIVRPVAQRTDIGITWDKFEQAASSGMPVLIRGLGRLLGPFYKDPEKGDFTTDHEQRGKVASWPVLAQLGSLRIFSRMFIAVQLYKYYDVRTTPVTASALADDPNAFAKAAIVVLVSGKDSQTKEKKVFGYYVPDIDFERERPYLFQLCDIQNAFRGNGPRPGRELDGDELVFGQKGNGAALVLQQDLKRAVVSHSVSGQHEPLYAATTWGGDWRVEIEVEEIELWLEESPDFSNYGYEDEEEDKDEEDGE